ncbi:hypothetical protein BC833DRAFT_620896 [Globomyces pollinis-pini]|nr:hypothetical protein BC833DRAFT_620896 [Globomyces pollinis-pini]
MDDPFQLLKSTKYDEHIQEMKNQMRNHKGAMGTGCSNGSRLDLFVSMNELIPDYSFLTPKISTDSKVDYLSLRTKQNKAWANQQAVEGIMLAKQNELESAIKKYDSALDLDGECVSALVARGAALANLKKYSLAMEDLKLALVIEPSHTNAQKYLKKLEDRLREREQLERNRNQVLISGEFVLPENYDPRNGQKQNLDYFNSIGGKDKSDTLPYDTSQEIHESRSRSKKEKKVKKDKREKKSRKRRKSTYSSDEDSRKVPRT